MKLKKLHICNYRQFADATINFEDDITVLAGTNNSGKTSLIELFKNIFDMQKNTLCEDDIPVMATKKWIDEVYVPLEEIIKNNKNKDESIRKIIELISPKKKDTKPLDEKQNKDNKLMETISVDIEITYDENENISKFADYLMDLDDNIKSFFFKFEYKLNVNKLEKILDEKYEQLASRFKSIEKDKIEGKNMDVFRKENSLKEHIISLYVRALEGVYFFTDSQYDKKVQLDSKDFKALFNFHIIEANRTLDDELSDKKHLISKGMINFISQDDEWNNLVKNLPDSIIEPIQDTGIKEKIRKKSLDGLSEAMQAISQTNGGHTGQIVLDMDVDNEAIKSLLKNITNAKYKFDDFYLKEAAQGLGYSNMIYMHLQLESYLKQMDISVINIFIIEEPEAHMHPQMQKVFMQYLFDFYKKKKIQGLVTSHSSEIVRETSMKKLRVIRPLEPFKNKIYDMDIFLNKIQRDLELKNFYNNFFNINFSSIIFADKIIMYEGDTERMFLHKIIQLDKFEVLKNQYIAFIQVGGAYAHNYKEIVEFLGIKTLIFTDIDYEKECTKKSDILKSSSTNETIKKFFGNDNEKKNPDIQTIYEWGNEKYTELIQNNTSDKNSTILIRFQGEEDNYARTLEEAMFTKYFDMEIEDKKTKKDWKIQRSNSKLKFTIPRKDGEYNIRDIVQATSDTKTDFMYSVIINELVEEMLPKYIEEGLEWLMK